MVSSQLTDYFQRARRDKSLAIIEGVQAIKHAVRFGAEFKHIITCDIQLLAQLMSELAPDISDVVLTQVQEVEEIVFNRLSPQPPRTKIIGLAGRKNYSPGDLSPKKPLVFLEDPRDLENIGAVIRVSAAADAAGVAVSGPVDIWHQAVVRGAAGLHYAIPVLSGSLEDFVQNRPVVALDPTGDELGNNNMTNNALLIFGTERHGISEDMLAKANQIIRLPMKSGVSSLNLATSVAATLYKM